MSLIFSAICLFMDRKKIECPQKTSVSIPVHVSALGLDGKKT